MSRTAFAILLLWSISSLALAGTEVGQLIRSALLEQKNGYLPWSFYAQPGSPVEWQTNGIAGFKRDGKVILAVAGFVPEILGKNVEPGKWSISVSGDKFGIHSLQISTDSCFGSAAVSKDCFARIEQFPKSLKLAGVDAVPICQFGPGSTNSQVYEIKVLGGTTAFLHSLVNVGSGGETLDLNLIYRSQSKGNDLEHGTAICALLFQSTYGADSNVAADYQKVLDRQR